MHVDFRVRSPRPITYSGQARLTAFNHVTGYPSKRRRDRKSLRSLARKNPSTMAFSRKIIYVILIQLLLRSQGCPFPCRCHYRRPCHCALHLPLPLPLSPPLFTPLPLSSPHPLPLNLSLTLPIVLPLALSPPLVPPLTPLLDISLSRELYCHCHHH